MSNNTALTTEALKILDAIDRKGSFAGAANALYRVPSAITYAVQKLEQELGITLFKKEGRRAIMTPEARLLLEEGRTILNALEQLQKSAHEVASGWEPVLNIAINSILGLEFIYPALTAFYQQHPHIEVNLYEEVLSGSWEAIMNERVDLIVGASNEPLKHANISIENFSTTQWLFCVAPQHPLAKIHGTLNLETISHYKAIVVRDSVRDLAPISQRLFSKSPILSVPIMSAKIAAIQQNLGVGFLPKNRIQPLIKKGALVTLTIDDHIGSTDLFLAWRTKNKGKALNWFISYLNSRQN